MTHSADDLFRPSLQEHRSPVGRAPWRLSSQLWVWFFGGPLAAVPIAWINARRLGLPAGRVGAVVGVGAAALAVHATLLSLWLQSEGANLRLATRVVAVLAGLGANRVMRDADRRFQALDGRPYASLWVPGIAAVAAGIAVSIAILASLKLAAR